MANYGLLGGNAVNPFKPGDFVEVTNPNAKKVKPGTRWYVTKIGVSNYGPWCHLCAVYPWTPNALGEKYVNPNNLSLIVNGAPVNPATQPVPPAQPQQANKFNPGDMVVTVGGSLPKGWKLTVQGTNGTTVHLVSAGGSKYTAPETELSLVASAPTQPQPVPQQPPAAQPTTAQPQANVNPVPVAPPAVLEAEEITGDLTPEDLADIAQAEQLQLAEAEGRVVRGVIDPLGRPQPPIILVP